MLLPDLDFLSPPAIKTFYAPKTSPKTNVSPKPLQQNPQLVGHIFGFVQKLLWLHSPSKIPDGFMPTPKIFATLCLLRQLKQDRLWPCCPPPTTHEQHFHVLPIHPTIPNSFRNVFYNRILRIITSFQHPSPSIPEHRHSMQQPSRFF